MTFSVAIIGILINLAGGISTAFGWATQKYAHNEANKTNSSWYGLLKWWLGLALVIAAQPLYIVSSALANQSTLGVVGPFSLIASMFFARFMLNEKITYWEYWGILLFVPGIILTLMCASMENNHLNQEQFNKIFYSKTSMIYLGFNLTIVLLMAIISVLTIKHFAHIEKETEDNLSSDENFDDEIYSDDEPVTEENKANYLPEELENDPFVRKENHNELINNPDHLWGKKSNDNRSEELNECKLFVIKTKCICFFSK